jgi:hypothetical protein
MLRFNTLFFRPQIARYFSSTISDLGKTETKEFIDQRNQFESALKMGAQSLSNKTDAATLVKLLKMNSYIEKADQTLIRSLFEHLKPKVFTVENDELA